MKLHRKHVTTEWLQLHMPIALLQLYKYLQKQKLEVQKKSSFALKSQLATFLHNYNQICSD